MKRDLTLTVTTLLSILLFTVHFADDIARGFEPGGFKVATGVFIAAVWLYATLALAERRLGLVLVLLGSILGTAVPLVHMRGAGLVGGRIAGSTGTLLWVWTLIALGTVAGVSAVLSARALWGPRRQAGPHQSSATGRD